MIRRFQGARGRYVEKIPGQDRFGFANTGDFEFYEAEEQIQNGIHPKSALLLFDFETARIEQPFEEERDVLYGSPIYEGGAFWFLRCDFEKRSVVLIRYLPGEEPETVTELRMDEVHLYNLGLIGSPVHIISQDETFCSYYPRAFAFPLGEQESVILVENGKVYSERWVEEGWDAEKNCAGAAYAYYDCVLTRDEEGNLLAEEIGNLFQTADGTWWIT